MKPTIKYLLNGEYHYATVKDIGDIETLKTVVKTDLVSAINSVLGNVPDNYQQLIKKLEDALNVVANSGLNDQQIAEMESVISKTQAQIVADLTASISEVKGIYDQKLLDMTSKYDADVLLLNKSVGNVKANLTATEVSLEKTKENLSSMELNVTDVTKSVDAINGVLITKVNSTDFELLESTVNSNVTEINQSKEDIKLKAGRDTLDLATGRITDAEAKIELNSNAITTTVKKDELKGNLDGLDIYGANILYNTMDWHEWTSTVPSKAYLLNDTYQHTIIQEQKDSEAYYEDIVDGLKVGETYNASVWAKSTTLLANPIFKINNVEHIMSNVNSDTFIAQDWRRYKVKFVADSEESIVAFLTNGLINGDIAQFAGGKLETGLINTGWRPNEKDANKRVSSAESSIVQQADKIVSIVTKQEKTDVNVSQQRTEINQMANEIGLTAGVVSDIEGRVSSTESSIILNTDNIALKVEQKDVDKSIGNIKLDQSNSILNSNFVRGFEDWTNVNANFVIEEINSRKYARISRSGLYNNLVASMNSNKFPVSPKDKLSIGFDVIVDNLTSYDVQNPIMIELFDINDVRVTYKEYTLSDFGKTLKNGVEERLTTSLVVERDDVAKASIKLTLYRNGVVSYTNISVRKGDIGVTGWTPAPEDNQAVQASLLTAINQNAEQIELRAEKSTVDKVSGELTDLSSKFSVANDSIQANITKLTKVDGVLESHSNQLIATAKELVSKMTSIQVNELVDAKGYASESEFRQTSEGFEFTVSELGKRVSGLSDEVKTTMYTWIMWANDGLGSGISANPEGKLYMGVSHNRPTIDGSLIPTDYTWKKVEGEKGDTGESTVVTFLTKDSVVIPTSYDGSNGNYANAYSEMRIFKGINDDTKNWVITVKVSEGIEGNLVSGTYTVKSMSSDSGQVEFSAKQGEIVVSKAFSLSKSKQGSNGESAITAFLTNDIHTIATDSDGKNGDYTNVSSTIKVLKGTKDDTKNWIITAKESIGLIGHLNGATYVVEDLMADSGEVEITATQGTSVLNKFFTIIKSKQGIEGMDSTVYRLKKSQAILIRGKDGFLNPSTITFDSTKMTGNEEVEFKGYYVVHERSIKAMTIDEYTHLHSLNMIIPEREYIVSNSNQPYVKRYESRAPESQLVYVPNDDIVSLHVELYKDSEHTQLLDNETVMVASDGMNGADAYRVEIISTKGNIFKNGEIGTTLLANVYKGSEDITDMINAANFKWTRSSTDETGDIEWNTRHAGGKKQVAITNEDVYVRATFSCQILEA